jgi:hypothetical protein
VKSPGFGIGMRRKLLSGEAAPLLVKVMNQRENRTFERWNAIVGFWRVASVVNGRVSRANTSRDLVKTNPKSMSRDRGIVT